ncbi:hypothetical protein HMPREF1554_01771 [Porphyromonas gingivalis F0569]|nr:hypothetical protein HMPREF1554_01771 [Porphyromonas gingivalis F0569]
MNRTFGSRGLLSKRLGSDLYNNQFQFIYRSFSIYILIIFHLYIDCIRFVYK